MAQKPVLQEAYYSRSGSRDGSFVIRHGEGPGIERFQLSQRRVAAVFGLSACQITFFAVLTSRGHVRDRDTRRKRGHHGGALQ